MERGALVRILVVATSFTPFFVHTEQAVASIQNATTLGHICNGVIIHEQWILTSAKCVRNRTATELSAFYGSKRLNENGNRVGIKKIHVNSGFDEKQFKDDVALLYTTAKINLNASGSVILPAKDVAVNQTLIVRGWKLMDDTNEPNLLQYQMTQAISGQQCRQLNPSLDHIIRSWLICTTDNAIEQNNCADGLGSPLISQDNILYGIMSMFRRTCGVSVNDIYTNIYSQISWIWFIIEGW